MNAGELKVVLKLDDGKFKASLLDAEGNVKSFGGASEKESTRSSKAFGLVGTAAVAMGNIIAKSFEKIASVISQNIGAAIKRVDILNAFPGIMENMGIASDVSERAIRKLADKLVGLPTTLDAAALSVQRFTSKNKDVEKSSDLFLALNNAILAGAAPMDLQSTAMEQFSQAFAKGSMDMVEWRSLMSAMPAQLSQLADSMGYVSADALGEALRNGELSMERFGDELVKLNTDGVGNMRSFEDQAKASTGGIETTFKTMESAVVRGITKVIKSIGEGNIADTATRIGEAFEAGLSAAAQAIDFMSQSIAMLLEWLKPLTDYIARNEAVMQVLKTTGLVLAGILGGAIIAAVGAVIIIAGLLVVAIEFLVKTFEFVMSAAVLAWDGIKAAWSVATKFFQNIWNSIKGAYSSVTSWFGNLFRAAWDTIKSAWSSVVNWFSGLWSGIKGAFGAVGSWFGGVFRGAWDAITGALSGLGHWAKDRLEDIKRPFSNMWQVGKDIVQGLWNGIGDMAGWIKGKIEGFGGDIMGKLKSFFKIHSPSRLLRDEIGKMLGLGIGDGIMASLGAVLSDVSSFGGEVFDAMQTVLSPQYNADFSGSSGVLSADDIWGSGSSVASSPVINQVNHINTEVDMNIVNRSLMREARRAT